MTAKDFRKSLLQEAIKGNLSKHNYDKEDALNLYDSILKETIKEDKRKISIEENEYPFEIPKNWCWCRLRTLCYTDISYGIIKLYNEDPNGVKVLRCSDVKENTIDLANVRTVTKSVSDEYKRTILNGGEIVINVRGTLGGCAVVPQELKGFNVAREVAVIRPHKYLNIQYLTYVLLSPYFKDFMTSELRGIAYKGLNMGTLSSFPVPLPPLEEQNRIVENIHKTEKLIDNLTIKEKELNSINSDISIKTKNAVLQEALQGKLVAQFDKEGNAESFIKQIRGKKENAIKEGKIKKEKKLTELTENEIPFDIPDTWRWIHLTDACNMFTGDSINETEKKLKYTNIPEGRFYIGTKDVGFDKQINYDNGVKIPYEKTNFSVAPKDSVLLCIEGGSAGRKIAITKNDVCFGNKLCCFDSYEPELKKFIYYYLQSPMFTNAFKNNITGIIGGVSIGKLKAMPLPIPPMEEQKRIVAAIEKLLPLCEKLGR